MTGEEPTYWITPTLGATTLPVEQILTGRGAILGKSGSGKSNTTSVIIEQLIESGYTLLVVDPEGEYVGLKESYDVLHAGKGADCDVSPSLDDVSDIVQTALYDNTPVVLDVSDYLDADFADSLVCDTLTELFQQENDAQKPFLTVVEEIQEYLPQSGGTDEVSEIIERIAKRGRKRGLGMLGISQRPSSVDKDFVTQCDWMVWHRLTWKNDITVVRDILGSDYANEIERLETGEAFLMTDWDEDIERVKFRRKTTRDAGATPGLEQYENVANASADESDPPAAGADAGADEEVQPEAADGEQEVDSPDDAATDDEIEGESDGEQSVDDADGRDDSTPESESATAPTADGADIDGADANGATGSGGLSGTTVAGGGGSQPATQGPPTPRSEAGAPPDPSAHLPASAIPAAETDLDPPVTPEALDTVPRTAVAADINALHEQNITLRERLETMAAHLHETEEYADFGLGDTGADLDDDPSDGPTPPQPPDPPEPRSGVAGSLVEFSLLFVYMVKLLAFRLRHPGRRGRS